MDNFETINKNTVQKLIAKYKVKPEDAKYVISRANRSIPIAVFLIFIYSLIHLFFSKTTDNNKEVIVWAFLFCVIYFVYDFLELKRIAMLRFKRELWLLKTLLENEDISQFYKAQGASDSQGFFEQENIKNWRWNFDFASHMRRSFAAYFIKSFNLTNSKAIELGCAEGYFLNILSSYRNITYGIDLNMDGLRKVAENKNLYLCQADIERIPFKAFSFNTVLCLEVLEHLRFPQAAIAEAGRILKPGGILFLSTPNINSMPFGYLLNPLKFFMQLLTVWFEDLYTSKPLINIWRGQYYFHTAFSRKEIKIFLGNNFKIKSWGTYGIGGGLTAVLLKLKPSLRTMFRELNEIEQKRKPSEDYTQLRKCLSDIEAKYGRWLGKINIYLQKIPLIKLTGTNHFIVLEKIC